MFNFKTFGLSIDYLTLPDKFSDTLRHPSNSSVTCRVLCFELDKRIRSGEQPQLTLFFLCALAGYCHLILWSYKRHTFSWSYGNSYIGYEFLIFTILEFAFLYNSRSCGINVNGGVGATQKLSHFMAYCCSVFRYTVSIFIWYNQCQRSNM